MKKCVLTSFLSTLLSIVLIFRYNNKSLGFVGAYSKTTNPVGKSVMRVNPFLCYYTKSGEFPIPHSTNKRAISVSNVFMQSSTTGFIHSKISESVKSSLHLKAKNFYFTLQEIIQGKFFKHGKRNKKEINDSSRIGAERRGVNNSILKKLGFLMRYLLFPASLLVASAKTTIAMGGTINAEGGINSPVPPVQGLMLWALLFIISSLMHSAESAITKISPWKVKEFADEEGPDSPFAALSSNTTRLLITILLTTTACGIYSTALFVASVSRLFPQLSLGIITAALTAITLFVGELLPKALAVSNSELVARKLVPPISRLSMLLLPFTSTVTFLSELILQLAGMRSVEDKSVSEDMLRMVVDEAQRSEGIESAEGRMIKAVLDMQDKDVERIMQPRVEIVAVEETSSAAELLRKAVQTKYSRLPIYRGDIDNIVGIVFSKDLLDFMSPVDMKPYPTEEWQRLTAKKLLEEPYFIPETMSCWTALQEMRRRRVHMAIVVDEYGGTSGLVTFEDILEEVVGEIYDEDDGREDQADDYTIFRNENGTFLMKAYAELDDVCEALKIELDEEQVHKESARRGEYSTIGGLLCSIAGRIPQAGDKFDFAGYSFVIRTVEGNKRIIDIFVEPLVSDNNHSADSSGNEPESSDTFDNADDRGSNGTAGLKDDSSAYLQNSGTANGASHGNKVLSAEESLRDSDSNGELGLNAGGNSESSSVDNDSDRRLVFRDGEWVDPNIL